MNKILPHKKRTKQTFLSPFFHLLMDTFLVLSLGVLFSSMPHHHLLSENFSSPDATTRLTSSQSDESLMLQNSSIMTFSQNEGAQKWRSYDKRF